MVQLRWSIAAVLLQCSTLILAHGHDDNGAEKMDGKHAAEGMIEDDLWGLPSYSQLSAHSGMMLAHIILMVLAWFFILPIGKWNGLIWLYDYSTLQVLSSA